MEPLTAAADRALDESRRAIAALTRPVDEPLDRLIAEAVQEVGDRTDVPVRMDLAAGITLDAHVQEELLRIVREAVSNAGRHSGASVVEVALAIGHRGRLLITVKDDGSGFNRTTVRPNRFGLTTMRERAAKIGADLRISSVPDEGTMVEVILP